MASPGPTEIARQARAKLARRWLAHFVRQAVAAGVVDGISRVEWGPHLDAICSQAQAQLDGWLVANGHGSPEMIERQREAWKRTGAVWEDGEPEPWLRYVLTQNFIHNLPPGTLKSTIITVCANAWIWLWAPTFSFGALSGIDANVGRDSRACRDLVRSSWYRETFEIAWTDYDDPDSDPGDVSIKRDADAVEAWSTTAGGKRISRTINRGLTGVHVDGIVVDDADDADKVYNEAERLRPQNRWARAVYPRVIDRRSIRLVMQQVVHPEGFTAYLLSMSRWSPKTPNGWARLCIAAEYGHGPEDAPVETPYGWRDWRTEKGETLHPRLSAAVLADYRLNMPGYEGQFNQNPSASTDGIFERRYARFFVFEGERASTRARPLNCPSRADQPAVIVKRDDVRQLTLSIDAANSLDPKPGAKVSAVGLVVGGCWEERRLICDDRTRILGVAGTYRAIYELVAAWALDRILVEVKALGNGVIAEVTAALRRGWYVDLDNDQRVEILGPDGKKPRCTVEPFNPGKDTKEQRHHAMLPAWQQGEMLMLDGADWLYPVVDEGRRTVDEGFVGEICSLPRSRRTDRADATAQFVAHYRQAQDPKERWRAMSKLLSLVRR